MPRDSNSVYSLPAGYLAVTGETIQASQHNPPLEDIAAAINGAVARSGQLAFTGAMKAYAGTSGAPSIAFDGDPDTGFYWKSANVIGIVAGGSEVATISSTGVSVATAAIADDAVTYAKIQNVTHGKMLGRVTASDGNAEEVTLAFAQCRLVKSGDDLLLSPYRGNRLTINSAVETIPDVGVSLAPDGLTHSTLYYIYAYMNSGTMTLEASETGFSAQTGTGVDIKTGDATRTLVGLAYPTTGPVWTDSAAQRFVRSRFNESPVTLSGDYSTNRSTSSTSFTEVNTEIRVEFITWASEVVDFYLQTFATNGAQGGLAFSRIAFDGTEANSGVSVQAFTAGGGNSMSTRAVTALTVGHHYATMLGRANTNTATWDTTTLLTGLLKS